MKTEENNNNNNNNNTLKGAKNMNILMEESTKREKFEYILTIDKIANNAILSNFIKNEIKLLEKKSSYKKSHQTKKQLENANLSAKLLEILPLDKFISIEEIKQFNDFMELSTPKISALIRPLRESGQVVRDFDKKHAVYKRVQ